LITYHLAKKNELNKEKGARQHEEKLLSFKRIENLLHRMLEKENESGN